MTADGEDALLAARLARVDDRISVAARAAARDEGEITRIVVTKFHPASLIERVRALGVADVGENRQQELSEKIDEVADRTPGLHWHMIGQLQTNKARAIARAAGRVPLVVHSLDRDRLATALARAVEDEAAAAPLSVLVQINLTDDAGRGGTDTGAVERLAEVVLAIPALRLRGVMGVAPLDADPAAAFDALAAAAGRVRALAPEATWLSAGMSHDLEQAIAAGATHLRIGTAITGERPARG